MYYSYQPKKHCQRQNGTRLLGTGQVDGWKEMLVQHIKSQDDDDHPHHPHVSRVATTGRGSGRFVLSAHITARNPLFIIIIIVIIISVIIVVLIVVAVVITIIP